MDREEKIGETRLKEITSKKFHLLQQKPLSLQIEICTDKEQIKCKLKALG